MIRPRVDPLSARAAARSALVSATLRDGGLVFVSGHPPDPEGRAARRLSIGRQAERALEQMSEGLAAAGSSLDRVVKCTVYCTDPLYFDTIHAIYRRYFPSEPPIPLFVCVGPWPEPFDLEIDCVAAV